MTLVCSVCHESKPRLAFSGNHRQCRECMRRINTANYAAWSPERKRVTIQRASAARSVRLQTDPAVRSKRRIRATFWKAVKRGSFPRPDTCSKCNAVGPVQGHHDDYSKPFEVIWLCRKCHTIAHRIYP